jgi:hypothetical protein
MAGDDIRSKVVEHSPVLDSPMLQASALQSAEENSRAIQGAQANRFNHASPVELLG